MKGGYITRGAITIISLTLLFTYSDCTKLVEAAPPPTISGVTVFDNDLTAIAAVSALYISISSEGLTSPVNFVSLSKLAGLSSDELTLRNNSSDMQVAYYKNALSATTAFSAGSELWNDLYIQIFTCNNLIPGLSSSSKLTPSIQRQLLGEVKFMRAFLYFYLVNLYGDIPLVLSTDYEATRLFAKSPKMQVYQQMISDLTDAKDQLSADFLDGYLHKYSGSFERLRPTTWAASALLARVYLFTNDWVDAENETSNVINQTSLFKLVALNSVFQKNSSEAILQLQPVIANTNTQLAANFIIPSTGINTVQNSTLSDTLLKTFEVNDNRKSNWIGSVTVGSNIFYFPYKYKVNTGPVMEYLMLLRLAEQYLIRAEARLQQNKIGEAQDDLNAIRTRAGLPNTTANDKIALLAAITHERQVELFTEWGDRWINLKRTNSIDAIMSIISPMKGGTWVSYQQLYPLPLTDIQKNINLIQNSGY